jgi:hypothetical protein
VPSVGTPRIEVDFNKWGVSHGVGRVQLPEQEVERLRSEGFDVRPGAVVRAVDHDLDEHERPCWLEVDAEVGWDHERGWYGDYEQHRMERDQIDGPVALQARSPRACEPYA